jgi:hypothetical protein
MAKSGKPNILIIWGDDTGWFKKVGNAMNLEGGVGGDLSRATPPPSS